MEIGLNLGQRLELGRQARTRQTALAQIGAQCGLGADGKGWLAFGDTTNDLEMLEWAEWSVCPANAKNIRAKRAAKEVSPFTNDEAFVAVAIERALGAAAASNGEGGGAGVGAQGAEVVSTARL